MTDEKVYTPEVIEEQPFPNQEEEVVLESGNQEGQVAFSPTTTKSRPLPQKRVAVELIGKKLNTKSQKILAEFQFTEHGAIQVGKYTNGVSGDIRLSPNGITARNKSGLTTFALDGDTGDAVFAGTIQAGSIIVAETIVTEKATNGNGRTVYYVDGIPAIVIGDPS